MSLEDKFWRHVPPGAQDECWEWGGVRSSQGYGVLSASGGVQVKAHRLSLELHGVALSDGMLACHHCDNPPCVNPRHLYAGTPQSNSDDAVARNRTPRGERNLNARLTVDAVIKIRNLRKQGAPLADIANMYGVSLSAISSVVKRRSWKHVA